MIRSGPSGPSGADGLCCWDINEDGLCNTETEDRNSDGFCDALDCQGGIHVYDADGQYLGLFIENFDLPPRLLDTKSQLSISLHWKSSFLLVFVDGSVKRPLVSAAASVFYVSTGCPQDDTPYFSNFELNDEVASGHGLFEYWVFTDYREEPNFYIATGDIAQRSFSSV